MLAANDDPGVITAIVAPPTIYGTGRGPVNRRSKQVNAMARFLLHEGYAPIIGPGKAEWDGVHIHDLAAMFALLVQAALDPARNRDPDLFGPRAYYFLENGSFVWGEVAHWVAEAAFHQGFMAEPKTETLSMEDVLRIAGRMGSSWGTNSKSVAVRARKYLGWQPHGRSLKEDIPDTIKDEAEILGIKPTTHPH